MDIREAFRSTLSSLSEKRADQDENDSQDSDAATGAMHNSIMEPIEMPSWVGGRAARTRPFSSSFQDSFSESSNSSEFWNHRGAHVDPTALKFAGNESEKDEQPTGFRLPIDIFHQPKKEVEEQEDEAPEHHGMAEAAATMDWDAFIRDVTVAPSKTEAQGGLDYFFGFMTGRNQAIQKKDDAEKKEQSNKGLLGTMLDRASDNPLDTNGPSVTSGTIETSKSDRSRTEKRFFMMHQDEPSVVSDNTPDNGIGFPWNRRSSLENSQQDSSSPLKTSSNAKKDNDDCSNGSIGSSASWDPYQDIWDEDMDNTAKRVEVERRVVPKRTGKELWQIVRDNRRVIIGKSLRIQDIIMMSKRPWRKAPVPVSERKMSEEEEKSETKEPEDVALNMEDELALVSLAPETIKHNRKKSSKDHKKKHRSRSKDGESTTTGRSSRISSKGSGSETKTRRRSTSVPVDGRKSKSKRRSDEESETTGRSSQRRSKAAGGKSKTRRRSISVPANDSKTKSKSTRPSSSRRRHTVPADKKEQKHSHRSKSSSKDSKREKKNKFDSSKHSVASGTTTIATTASMAAAFSPPESILDDKHRRKTSRSDDSKRTVTEYSNSSAEMSDKVAQLASNAGTTLEFRAFLNEDKEANVKSKKHAKRSTTDPVVATGTATPSVNSKPAKGNRASLEAFLAKDKAVVKEEEEQKKRKKKSKRLPEHAEGNKPKEAGDKSRRRYSTATSSKPQKIKSKGRDESRGRRRTSV